MTAPMRVVAVDLGDPFPGIDSAGGRYRSARIFVFAGGSPTGELRVALPPEGLTAARVGELIADAGLTGGRSLAQPPAVRVSVVVATDLARPEALRACLGALAGQDHPAHEVIVVVNRPSLPAGSAELVHRALPGARIVVEPRRGASLARNRGLAEATGAVVAFTDDDALPARWWLRAVALRFAAEPDAVCVTGLVLPAQLETDAQLWFEESGNAFHQSYRPASFAGGPFTVVDRLAAPPVVEHPVYAMGPFGTGCNLALRRESLLRMGGFDPALGPGTPARAGEDLLLILRLLCAGERLAYEPAAVVWHRHRADASQLRSQVAGFGRGFTAMLTAAVLRDRRHVWGLLRFITATAGRRRDGGGTPAGAPGWLRRARRRGELLGPAAYLAARLRLLRWRR